MVKSAWLDGEEAVAALERDADALSRRDPTALEAAIRRSVSLKAQIVAEDERESGRRAVLNLGHTVGHAIEAAREYRGIRPGEAVELGCGDLCVPGIAVGQTDIAESRAGERSLVARGGGHGEV